MPDSNTDLKSRVKKIYDCEENVLSYLVKSHGNVKYRQKDKSSILSRYDEDSE